MSGTETHAPERWAIVELMGHVTRVGRVSTVQRYGTELLQLDVPAGDGFVSEDIGGSAIYRIRYVTEEVARAQAARMADPRPVAPAGFRPTEAPAPTLLQYDSEVDDERY